MKKKLYDVLFYLSKQTIWKTASEISVATGYSVRSLKNYVSELNSSYPNLILTSRNGYLLSDKEQAYLLLNSSHEEIPQTPEGRKAYIMQKLLIENLTKDLDELSSELCISPLTLANEIAKFKKELIPFDLISHTKNNKIWIEGTEKNKKKMISHMIYENTRDFCCNVDSIQIFLPNFDLRIIRHIVTSTIMEFHYFIDDFSLLHFILHIGITMERISKQADTELYSDLVFNERLEIPEHIIAIVTSISEKIDRYFHIKLGAKNLFDLELLLMTRLVHELEPDAGTALEDLVSPEIQVLLEQIQTKIRSTFHLNLNSQDFLIRFALHLKNMLIRLENQIDLKNPQLHSIKNSYPFIYDVSVFIADIIHREKGFLLSEDEIAYITLHIGILIEEQRAIRNKIKILLICPQYYDSKINMVKKISMFFEKTAILCGVLAGPEELSFYRDYDLIVSTMVIHPAPPSPVVQVPYLLRNSDILSISSAIESINKTRMKRILEQKLKFLFRKELFFYDLPFKSETDAITYMADRLEQYGYVDSTFKQKLFDWEKISSSAFSNIAMPHPLEMTSRATAIAVSIHPNAFAWNENKVNLIFMLAINENDNILFRDIFDFVTEIISDTKYCQTLLTTKTYDDFIHYLVSFS